MASNFPTKGIRSKRRRFTCIFQVVASLNPQLPGVTIYYCTYAGTERWSLYSVLKVCYFVS